VRARIIWASRPALLVPVLAVLRVNGLPFVFVAEERNGQLVAAQQPVRLGQLVGDQFTVLDGLQPGMRIIVSGVQRLGDGSPVNPQT
jgi:multidrug efflux pump subunit AcrA (membrane-fusion protein)